MNNRKTGYLYESKACEYLQETGVTLLERNFRTRSGEVDIIGLDGNTLVFFEIKFRRDCRKGSAQEAVDYRKQHQIIRTAMIYLMKNRKYSEGKIRFDVIAYTGNTRTHIKNAFGM